MADENVTDLASRFERSVDRSGDHHRWTGAVDPRRGTGRIKITGRTITANRVGIEIVEEGHHGCFCFVPQLDRPFERNVESAIDAGKGGRHMKAGGKPSARKADDSLSTARRIQGSTTKTTTMARPESSVHVVPPPNATCVAQTVMSLPK